MSSTADRGSGPTVCVSQDDIRPLNLPDIVLFPCPYVLANTKGVSASLNYHMRWQLLAWEIRHREIREISYVSTHIVPTRDVRMTDG